MASFEDEDLARLAWAFASLDLAPPELTQLLVAEAAKRDQTASERGGSGIAKDEGSEAKKRGDGKGWGL